jgi:hypothetical protein
MAAGTFIGRFNWDRGRFVGEGVKDERHFEMFKSTIPEGHIVQMYMEIVDPNEKSLSQLAKIHTMIRQLAIHAGETFDEMKKNVKDKAGLAINGNYRSFTDCTTDELNLAIRAAVEIGEFIECFVD